MKTSDHDKAMAQIHEKEIRQQEPEFIQQSNLTIWELCRRMATKAIVVIIIALAAIGWNLWENRDQSQINRILFQSSHLVWSAVIDREGFDNVEAWLRTLVIAGKPYSAIESARKIRDAELRTRVMASIVGALWKTGKTGEALPIANEALESARKIEDAGYRSQAIVNIIEVLGKIGKTDEALESARKIEDANLRSRAMASIVGALGKAGKTGEALPVANEALESARKIEDADLRSRAMASIVGALGKAGKAGEALPVASEALESALKIKDADYRSQAMVNIVEVLGKIGKTDEALESARKIEDPGYRSQAMVIVAEEMTKNREEDKAKSILNEAQRAAQQATKNSEKSTRLSAVAIGLAKLHQYYLARDIADLCTSSNHRLAAYNAIVREYLIKQNPSLEKLFDEEMQE